jgi:hypothetical protein
MDASNIDLFLEQTAILAAAASRWVIFDLFEEIASLLHDDFDTHESFDATFATTTAPDLDTLSQAGTEMGKDSDVALNSD